VVTICTTSLTFNNSAFCPHNVFMCFVWVWEQTAIISQCSINWLVFITETKCLYCAVRTGYLNVIHINFRLRWVKRTWLLSFMLSINVLNLGKKRENQALPTHTHWPGLVTEFRVVSDCGQQIKRTRKECGVVLSVVSYHWIKQQAKHTYLSKCSPSEGWNTSVCSRNTPTNFLSFRTTIFKASLTKFPGKCRLHVTKRAVVGFIVAQWQRQQLFELTVV
jgi:hypothetical protein